MIDDADQGWSQSGFGPAGQERIFASSSSPIYQVWM
jgi:hypothetical protein